MGKYSDTVAYWAFSALFRGGKNVLLLCAGEQVPVAFARCEIIPARMEFRYIRDALVVDRFPPPSVRRSTAVSRFDLWLDGEAATAAAAAICQGD